jgi:ring-1,2-phenylacetyl-CoA epoxidase subunit PaaC
MDASVADRPFVEFLLRLGDTALILSQRLSAWCGHGPILEEDLALTNTALDLLGQARMWLTLAGEVEGAGRDEDALAYRRDAPEFRNALLVEQPNGDYAQTMTRQYFFDAWHYLLLQRLCASADERVAAIASKSLKEVAYHLRRSGDLVLRLGDGTPESHARMQRAVDALWPYTGELFVDDAVDTDLATRGIGCELAALHPQWLAHVRESLDEATLRLPELDPRPIAAYRGGRQGRHTEALGYVLAEMQFLQRAYPGATW